MQPTLLRTRCTASARFTRRGADMDLNKKYGYKPYSGGAGPDRGDVASFHALLVSAATAEGLSVTFVENEDDLDADYVVNNDNTDLRVCYDRWGYVSGE